jgi:hypothetical protein
MSDVDSENGANVVPTFQRGGQGGSVTPGTAVAFGVVERRARWGKLKRTATCNVCGRKLWVNWTRARPCLYCDKAARDAS